MIFTIVKIRDTLKIYNDTERNLRRTLRVPFEVIEIVRTLEQAEQRVKELKKTTYKKPRKKRQYSPRRAYVRSKKMSGSGNIMYGKKHSEETKRKIAQKGLGNQRKRGKKHTEEAKDKYRQKRKTWKTVEKGNTVWHCPETGKNVRSKVCPPGYVHGFSEEVAEMCRWRLAKYKEQKRANSVEITNRNHKNRPSETEG
jgi:hypothetical protein